MNLIIPAVLSICFFVWSQLLYKNSHVFGDRKDTESDVTFAAACLFAAIAIGVALKGYTG